LRFSKVVSYGNAADLNEAELASYFAMDQESRILAFYVEGARDVEGFIEALRKAARAKPVFVLAGGTSIGGRRAVEAHTGKGTPLPRESLSRIPGVIIADSLEQLVDYLVAFSHPVPAGLRNVAVVGRGAGLGVLAADALEAEGFSVPSLSAHTRRAIARDFSFPGAMTANPIEPPGSASTWAPFLDKVLPILDKAQEIDLLLLNLSPDIHASSLGSQDDLEAVAAVIMSAMDRLKKPAVAVLASGDNIEVVEGIWSLMARLTALGIPVFYSVEAAASSIAQSQRWREGR
jgi:acyl-CoA synthetase (NDP forming)